MAANPRVVILGGGFGGLEATFYLRHKGEENGDWLPARLAPP